jgi:hypothetical protein
MKRYFQCTSNPTAPLLALEDWEADEMRNNLEYIEVDESGFPVVVPDEASEQDFA